MRIALCFVALTACMTTNEIETIEHSAKQAWTEVALPALRAGDCLACHGGATGFLAGTTDLDIRDTLLASGMVKLDAMTNSPLITKGIHEGNYLSREQTDAILAWLATE
jgi:mono/diheme cytochrome c family protein